MVLKSHFEASSFIICNPLSSLVHCPRQSIISRRETVMHTIICCCTCHVPPNVSPRILCPLVIALFDESDHASQCTPVVYSAANDTCKILTQENQRKMVMAICQCLLIRSSMRKGSSQEKCQMGSFAHRTWYPSSRHGDHQLFCEENSSRRYLRICKLEDQLSGNSDISFAITGSLTTMATPLAEHQGSHLLAQCLAARFDSINVVILLQ